MKTNIQQRRELRALEAKRDKLMSAKAKAHAELQVVRTQIKTARAKK